MATAGSLLLTQKPKAVSTGTPRLHSRKSTDRCRWQLQALAADSTPVSPSKRVVRFCEPQLEQDSFGSDRVALSEVGWSQWSWRGHKVNFLQAGDSGDALVLIHGFGASCYHWRYNIPHLAKSFRVFAIDLLGFGFSDKVVTDYTEAYLWSAQVRDFVHEVVGSGTRVVLVGNSLGGYVALATAARSPEIVKGVITLNHMGQYQEPKKKKKVEKGSRNAVTEWLCKGIERMRKMALMVWFKSTKARVQDLLWFVYASQNNVDEDLVRSILMPADDPNAADVFYNVIVGTVLDTPPALNAIFRDLTAPLLLLWGSYDPWAGPGRADKTTRLYKNSVRIDLEAGHCPHDEVPDQVNKEIVDWVTNLES